MFEWAKESWDLSSVDDITFISAFRRMSQDEKRQMLRDLEEATADAKARNKAIKTAERIGKLVLKYGPKVFDLLT